MVHTCVVWGCTNRAGSGDTKRRYYDIPKIIKHQGSQTERLSLERRNLWLTRINRDSFNPDSEKRHYKVCSVHFVTGNKSDLYDSTNPDWAPSLHMGPNLKPSSSLEATHFRMISILKPRPIVDEIIHETTPRYGRRCVAFGCSNTNANGVAVHNFPTKRPKIHQQWVKFVRRTRRVWKPTRHSVLCGAHFEEDCYPLKFRLGLLESQGRTIKKTLNENAVPTIYPPTLITPKPAAGKRAIQDGPITSVSHRSRKLLKKSQSRSVRVVFAKYDKTERHQIEDTSQKTKIEAAENSQEEHLFETELPLDTETEIHDDRGTSVAELEAGVGSLNENVVTVISLKTEPYDSMQQETFVADSSIKIEADNITHTEASVPGIESGKGNLRESVVKIASYGSIPQETFAAVGSSVSIEGDNNIEPGEGTLISNSSIAGPSIKMEADSIAHTETSEVDTEPGEGCFNESVVYQTSIKMETDDSSHVLYIEAGEGTLSEFIKIEPYDSILQESSVADMEPGNIGLINKSSIAGLGSSVTVEAEDGTQTQMSVAKPPVTSVTHILPESEKLGQNSSPVMPALKRHVCNICEKSFSRDIALQRHHGICRAKVCRTTSSECGICKK